MEPRPLGSVARRSLTVAAPITIRQTLPDRFYHPPPLDLGPATLDGPEAHHLIHVLRAKPGLEVTLFDGSGAEFPSRVEKLERAAVQLTVLSRDEIDRELPAPVTLAVSLPKGDRQRWLIEKAT